MADAAWADPKAVPRLQVVPQPMNQAAFVRGDQEIARYYFDPGLRRPFVFPVVGPSGRSLTRIGHPHDPQGHSHHNSLWVAHHDVDGVSFWSDGGKGRIVQQRLEGYEDRGETSWISSTNQWVDESAGNRVLLVERRRTTVELLPDKEWVLVIDLQLEAPKDRSVTLGKTPFGLVGVRMAKTIGVNDGGGEIRNSEGRSGEKDVLWRAARWVDYSGPIREGVVEGITLMDHPQNPNHPTVFHVRADGWMGTSLTQAAERVIDPGRPLRLRYGLYVHQWKQESGALDRRWEAFARSELPELVAKKK